jgi:hypothetical protein
LGFRFLFLCTLSAWGAVVVEGAAVDVAAVALLLSADDIDCCDALAGIFTFLRMMSVDGYEQKVQM